MPSVGLGWRFIKDGRHSGATWCCHCWDRMEAVENQQGGVNRVHSPSQGFPTQVLFPSLSTFLSVRDAHECDCTTGYVWRWEDTTGSQLSRSAKWVPGIKLRLLPWWQSLGTVAATRSLQEMLAEPVLHKFYAAFQTIKSQILLAIS